MTAVRQPPPTGGRITLAEREAAGATRVVAVGGEVDMATSAQLEAALLAALGHADLLVIDLERVVFLGTSGLAVLIEARSAAQAAGVALRLVCTSRAVLRPLTIAGLAPLFDVHGSVDTALRDRPKGV